MNELTKLGLSKEEANAILVVYKRLGIHVQIKQIKQIKKKN